MFSLNCKGKLLIIDKPMVMGILNVTPDSFYASSRLHTANDILLKATKMIEDGVDILDIGGQSTRPKSKQITVDEELERVLPAIEIIVKYHPDMIISIDTYHSIVAQKSIEFGASIINDISAGNIDNKMIATAAKLGVPYICMHMKGTPENMQENPLYENIIREVLDFFIEKIDECIGSLETFDERILELSREIDNKK